MITLMVCMTIGIIANMQYTKKMNEIKELEERLDRYYKEREQRLLNKDK